MEETYEKAFVEVLEIIKRLPEEEYKKIPREKINFFINNADKEYKFKINTDIPLEEQNISKKANAILVILFRDYFASDNQVYKLNEILKRNFEEDERKKQEKYNPENLFKEKAKISQNTELIVYKKNFFFRLIDKIKEFFRKA